VSMLGIGSTATLKWLVQLLYPELTTRVTRVILAREDFGHTTRPGISELDGRNVVGRSYSGNASGFVIRLVADEEQDELGRRWATIARERLVRDVLPLLAPYRLHLSVDLLVDSYNRHYRSADDEDLGTGELGIDRIYGKDGAPHIVRLFRGVTGVSEEE